MGASQTFSMNVHTPFLPVPPWVKAQIPAWFLCLTEPGRPWLTFILFSLGKFTEIPGLWMQAPFLSSFFLKEPEDHLPHYQYCRAVAAAESHQCLCFVLGWPYAPARIAASMFYVR